MADDIVGQTPQIEVRITAVVERDYKRRDVFPTLRIEHAQWVLNGSTGVHSLSIEAAEALLGDAEEQLQYANRRSLPRGMAVALGSLQDKLQGALKKERAVVDDWRKRVAEAEAEVKREADKLAELPATEEAFARRGAERFWSSFLIFYGAYDKTEPGDSGYCFSADGLQTILDIGRGMYRAILDAELHFDATRRISKVTEVRAKAAKVNMPLQRVLSAAIAQRIPDEDRRAESNGRQAA